MVDPSSCTRRGHMKAASMKSPAARSGRRRSIHSGPTSGIIRSTACLRPSADPSHSALRLDVRFVLQGKFFIAVEAAVALSQRTPDAFHRFFDRPRKTPENFTGAELFELFYRGHIQKLENLAGVEIFFEQHVQIFVARHFRAAERRTGIGRAAGGWRLLLANDRRRSLCGFVSGLAAGRKFFGFGRFFLGHETLLGLNDEGGPAPHDALCRSQAVDGRADDSTGIAGPFSDGEEPRHIRALARRRVALDSNRRAASHFW